MPICYECRDFNGEAGERWQYVTLNEPCDRCDNRYSHERKFGDGPR